MNSVPTVTILTIAEPFAVASTDALATHPASDPPASQETSPLPLAWPATSTVFVVVTPVPHDRFGRSMTSSGLSSLTVKEKWS